MAVGKLEHNYPPVGFFFRLQIDGLPDTESDFQEITGLSRSVELQSVKEGGENRFTHELPLQVKSEPLILKRGLKVSSELTDWCKSTIEEFRFTPKDIHLFLLDVESKSRGEHQPLVAWHIIHAFPTKWEVTGFNAMNNDLAIETIQLNYSYFTKTYAKPQ
jgi:phage tail-like protein